MKITKVWLDEGQDNCIACGMCASIVSEVFDVDDKMSVIEGVDYNLYKEDIKEAEGSCPVNVIRIEEA